MKQAHGHPERSGAESKDSVALPTVMTQGPSGSLGMTVLMLP